VRDDLGNAGSVGDGLAWGWLVAQMMPSLRPSPSALAGMGTATIAVYPTFYVLLDGQAAAIVGAASMLAVLTQLALAAGLRR